jgi:hypothetical protein
MSPIKHAAIVLIYEDGRPVEVIKMDETEIEVGTFNMSLIYLFLGILPRVLPSNQQFLVES